MSQTDLVPPPEALPLALKVAYVPLWFPLSSETFIFREIVQLRQLGLPIHVYTLYGKALKGCSAEMQAYDGPITRIGIRHSLDVLAAFGRALCKKPALVWQLMREALFRRMRSLETMGENTICFFESFYLAELCQKDGIERLHSPWGNGPGTAVWIASRLSGIPFMITGRAGDIYPPDGVLHEKLRDALAVRTNNAANVQYLRSFCPKGQESKVRLIYNSLTFRSRTEGLVPMVSPYKLLAVGRFVHTKGFDVLFNALALLQQEGFACHLTLVGGGGFQGPFLRMQRKRLKLEQVVTMPGFVPNDQLLQFMGSHDMMVVPCVVARDGDRDGIPNVIMEALSSRLPVVATDVSGISEVVRDGDTGLLVPQRDPKALACAIRRMAENSEAARAMAQRGKILVESMFDSRVNIRALYDFYVLPPDDWYPAREAPLA